MQGALEFEYRRLVGRRVRSEWVWHDLSQEELAAKAGVTRNFVSAIERGAQRLDAYRLHQIADALGLTFADLMATNEHRPH